MSRAEYLQALTGDQIDEAVINQNSEVPTGSITYQTNTDSLFHALQNGDVDGILASSVVAAYYMK